MEGEEEVDGGWIGQQAGRFIKVMGWTGGDGDGEGRLGGVEVAAEAVRPPQSDGFVPQAAG
jgi:hypothetical protein